MLDCQSTTQAMLNTDIFYTIVDQLAADNARDALQSMSRVSKDLGRICRAYLFRRVQLDIHNRERIAFFSSILHRDPQIARFVRQLSITDNTPPTASAENQRVEDGLITAANTDRYVEITHERSALSAILSRLENLSSVALLCRYVFASHHQLPLRWDELSSAVRLLFRQPGLTTTRLEGIRCIPLSMLDSHSATRPMLNTDIFYTIVDQLAADNARDALQSMSRVSKDLGRICRAYLFRRVTLDIHNRGEIAFFSSILDRDPQIARFVRELSITDNTPPPPVSAVNQRVEDGFTDRYIEITHERSALSAILSRLGNLSSVALLFRYVFASHHRRPLRWNELSPAVRLLFRQPGLTTIRLEGIRCIPISLSRTLLSMQDVRLSRCTFTQSLTDTDQHRYKSTRAVMKRLSVEWLGMGEEMDPDVECTTILAHWVYMSYKDHISLPDIAELSLGLGCWTSIGEASLFLNVFQHSIRALSLNTTGLHLEPLRLLPFYKAAIDRTVRPLAALHSKAILLLIAQGVTTLGDGWAAYDLQPVSLAHACSPMVRSLELSASYWDTAANHAQNGEMAWVCGMLANLPDERARAVETLSIRIKLGTHCAQEDAVVHMLTRFAEDEMWCVLNDTLSKEKWRGLRSLSIMADVPAVVVHPKLSTFSTLVLEHIHDNCLYDLAGRDILYLGFKTDM